MPQTATIKTETNKTGISTPLASYFFSSEKLSSISYRIENYP
jgi:hypothetical protein